MNLLIVFFLQLTKIAVQQGLLQQQGGLPFLNQQALLPGQTAPGMAINFWPISVNKDLLLMNWYEVSI